MVVAKGWWQLLFNGVQSFTFEIRIMFSRWMALWLYSNVSVLTTNELQLKIC